MGWMLLAYEIVVGSGGVQPPPPPWFSLLPLPAHPESAATSKALATAPRRPFMQRDGAPVNSVPVLERRLERRQVRELFGELLQAVENAAHFALRPLELLRAHLGERGAQLIVQSHQPLDPRHARFRHTPVDLAREVDDLICLPNLFFHGYLHAGQRMRPRA